MHHWRSQLLRLFCAMPSLWSDAGASRIKASPLSSCSFGVHFCQKKKKMGGPLLWQDVSLQAR